MSANGIDASLTGSARRETDVLRQALADRDWALEKTEAVLQALYGELAKTNAELRAAQQALEQKVRERTAELEEANRALSEELARRRRVESALRESREQLALAIDGSGGGLWDKRIDPEAWPEFDDTVYLSPELKAFAGRSDEELPNSLQAWRALQHPEDLPGIDEQVGAHWRGQADQYQHDYRLLHADGGVRWIHSRAKLIRDESGRPIRWVGIDWDITERKRVEEAVRASEEKYRRISENIPCVIYSARPDRGWASTFISGKVREITGWSRRDFLEQPGSWARIVHPDDLAVIHEALEGQKRRKAVFDVEYRIIARDGTVRWVRDRATPVLDEDGQIVRYDGYMEDITARRQAEKALRLRDRAIAAAAEGISITDPQRPDNPVVYVNQGFQHITGYDASEVLGRNLRFLQGPDTDPAVVKEIGRAIETRRSATIEVRNYRKDGAPFWNRMTLTPVLDESGSLVNFVGVHVDVTAWREAQQDRERLVGELARKNAELERFTYTVSHDLKTPLITVRGFLSHLRQDLTEGEEALVDEDMRRIESASARMVRLLNELLDLSRVGRVVNPPSATSLREVAEEAVCMLSAKIAARGVAVSMADDLPVVHADRSRVQEAMLNLLDNAVKHLGDQPAPRVEVGVRREPGQDVCFVRDNGIGIDPRHHDEVFELFRQLDPASDGTGMGLALARRVIEVHGGRLWVESEGEGRGSTFCFTLPPGDDGADRPAP